MAVIHVSAVQIRHVLRAALLVTAFASAACESVSTNVVGPSNSKCQISLKNNTSEVPASGGNGSITVTTTRDCPWSASAEVSWIAVSETSGQGPATVNYSVLANPNGTPRRGRVVVAEQATEVAQAA